MPPVKSIRHSARSNLRATFDNTDQRLLPGQFVRARVVTGERSGVFLVPQVAVQTSDLGNIVYIVNEKNEAIVQPVLAGHWMGKEWVIREGLKAGDKVIVDNIIKLRPGIPVAPHELRPGTPGISSRSGKVLQSLLRTLISPYRQEGGSP